MEKKPEMSTEMREKYYYEKIYKNYFSWHYIDHLPRSKEQWDSVIARMDINLSKYFCNLNKDAFILDSGCGVGYLEHYLIKNGFTNIHAIDISKEQIEIAKKCLERNRINYNEKVEFKNVDIFEHLSLRNSKYDIITFIDVLEHFKKYQVFEIMELAYSALKENGTLIIRVPNMEHPFRSSYNYYQDFTHEIGFTRSSLKQCFLANGFKKAEVKFEKSIPLTSKSKNILENSRRKLLSFILLTSSDSFNSDILGAGNK